MKPGLNRRNFVLKGAAASIALPFLESLLPRQARAVTTPIKRFVALFYPNGCTLDQDWQLVGSGANYTMGTAHDSLIPYKAKFSMFRNLDGKQMCSPDHMRGTIEFLTGARIDNMASPVADISIDQAMVNATNPTTAIRSLHLGPTPYPAGQPSDTGWPSGYNISVSWSAPTRPNAPLEDPQVAFDRVFAVGGAGTDPAAVKATRIRKSVLDYVLGQVQTISPRLGKQDGQKLGEYLTSLRNVELRLQQASQSTRTGSCKSGTRPAATTDFAAHTLAMLDVIALALQCDATRFVTYSMDYGFGTKDDSHHSLSHSGSAQSIIDRHKAIVKRYMNRFGYLLGKLDAIDEGGVTTLDNSIVFLGTDVGEPWGHSHLNLKTILAGKGAGALNPGRLIDASGNSYASFLLALGRAMDPKIASFAGTSTSMQGL